MALQNEILEGRFNRALTRLFRVLATPSPQLSPEIMPVVNLVPDLIENAGLREERWCMGSAFPPGVALNNAVGQLTNPLGSGVILAVSRLYLRSTVAASRVAITLRRVQGEAQFPVSNSGVLMDSRFASQLAIGFLATGAAIFGGFSGMIVFLPADVLSRVDFECILSPGNSLSVVNLTVNQTFDMGVTWRERQASIDELSL